MALQIEEASLFGHSEGGRIVSTLAVESNLDLKIPKLLIANSVGTGNNGGVKGMASSNVTNNELFQGVIDLRQALLSSIGSTAYALTHPRRFYREKQVIDEAGIELWSLLDKAVGEKGIDVTVLHAVDDHLISFDDARTQAQTRTHISFIPTRGGHSNVYTNSVSEQIVEILGPSN